MKRVLSIILAIFIGMTFFVASYAEVIKKNDILFARYGLRGEGSAIYFHNMNTMAVLIPLGTEIKVIGTRKEQIIVQRVDNGKKYHVYALSDFWDKFFVHNKNDIGMERVSKDKITLVENNQVIEGMTKEEVYLSKGCPAYIGYGVKSMAHSFEEVMKSDNWYYNVSSRKRDAVITFENGKVTAAVDRESKMKMKIDAIKNKK